MAFRHQENTVFRRVLCKLRNPVVARDLRFQPALKKRRRRTMEVIMLISWGPFPEWDIPSQSIVLCDV